MIVKNLRKFLNHFPNDWDYPEIEFNNQLFRFSIFHDGILILGLEMEVGEMIDILDTLDDDMQLLTAVYMKVEIE